jgi:hypothetical protein
MHSLMKILGYILAIIGLASVIKYLTHHEGCILCGWQKSKEEPEKRTGSRYGSNPVKY